MHYQAMKRHGENLNACYSVKEANLKKYEARKGKYKTVIYI